MKDGTVMPDDLCTRIADVINKRLNNPKIDGDAIAAAIIADLDLTETFGVIIGCNHTGHTE